MAVPTISLLRNAAAPSDPVTADTLAETVADLFSRQPTRILVAVVDDSGRPTGLIDRKSFMLSMSAEHGAQLYAGRSVSLLMNPQPLVVEGSRSIAEFTSYALSNKLQDFLSGFVVVEDGIYFGVSVALDLFRWLHERTRAMAAHSERKRIFIEQLIDNIPIMVSVQSTRDQRFVLVNRATEDILGYKRDEMLGRTADEVFPDDQLSHFAAMDDQVLSSGRMSPVYDDPIQSKTGETRCLSTRKLTVPDENGETRWLVRVSEDVTDRRRSQARIEQLAHCDVLTGLTNRALFQSLHLESIQAARESGTSSATLFIDLDRFKPVNDSLGHAAGDEVLRLVADRLRHCTRKDDIIARIGGDEFAIVQGQIVDLEDVARLARRVVETLAEPFKINGRSVEIGASIGFAVFPQDGDEAELILRRADTALYRAKATGRGRYTGFDSGMDTEQIIRSRIERQLTDMIATRNFVLHYQPTVCLATNRVATFEALVRAKLADGAFMLPGEFLTVAEGTAQILALGQQIISEACMTAAKLPEAVGMAINLSPLQARDPELIGIIGAALERSRVAPGRLEFDVSEEALLRNETLVNLHRLKDLGCRIAFDNFGSGTSCLRHLRLFPFDKIKIDRAIIQMLPADKGSFAIVRAIEGTARALGIIPIAQGVETRAQLQAVKDAGCEAAQGFLLGRPLPNPEFEGQAGVLRRSLISVLESCQ